MAGCSLSGMKPAFPIFRFESRSERVSGFGIYYSTYVVNSLFSLARYFSVVWFGPLSTGVGASEKYSDLYVLFGSGYAGLRLSSTSGSAREIQLALKLVF